MQREEVLPSERAWALKMKMEAMGRQGKRRDLTCRTECDKLEDGTSRTECDKLGKKTVAIVGEGVGLKARQVQKYIRLTELISELLDMVDDKSISVNIGYEIAVFDKDVQRWIFEYRSDINLIRIRL